MSFFKPDCRHFRGDLPCKPHKQSGYHCSDCPAYDKVTTRILIIKLGAIGDVIRTTPLLQKFRQEYPGCYITWLTWTPDILPSGAIDEILKFDLAAVTWLQYARFDIVVNLDKEKEAGALLAQIQAPQKFGYILKDNVIQPANEMAHHKYQTGLFDDVSKSNTKSYCEEIFEICGYQYAGEPYLLDNHADKKFDWSMLPRDKRIIGLNTGCGGRWTTRLWSTEKWINLIKLLQEAGYHPLLLGGEQEDPRNKELQKATGAQYLGYFSLPQFINLVDQCELVVTQVTMGMHITLGLGKKIVLMNNIFNPHEFDLFGKGRLVMPDKACKCFYKGACVDGISCMEQLASSTVFNAVKELVPQP